MVLKFEFKKKKKEKSKLIRLPAEKLCSIWWFGDGKPFSVVFVFFRRENRRNEFINERVLRGFANRLSVSSEVENVVIVNGCERIDA